MGGGGGVGGGGVGDVPNSNLISLCKYLFYYYEVFISYFQLFRRLYNVILKCFFIFPVDQGLLNKFEVIFVNA